ncbi:YtxH domain-containing protein [Pedobacter punctiformis]|uniref:YtxH domain-containing protein n=1 Tax=Pedobacter punctiformis TaxID=3004097 RepID=A0ABT4L601_9SPHI|nr:YtxH domain-containing protein [Pedobacter sp. HCMS5-2]MCZ4242583.1 YtxH domain-containing protein [Pedobacter sp. HCMS5-2]
MNLLKYALLGAAAVYGYKYAIKKRPEDGKSLVDDIKENLPLIFDQAKAYGEKIKHDYQQTTGMY